MKDLLEQRKYDLIIVDTMNLAHRSHYGMKMLRHEGKPTGMLYGIARFLTTVKAQWRRARTVFLMEGTSSRRSTISSEYKANRKEKESEFTQAFKAIPDFLLSTGVDIMYHIGLEADDMAGWLVEQGEFDRALLVTQDEDWFQFLRPGRVDILRKDVVETYEDIHVKLGYPPEKIGIWKALKGDKSDNVSGVPLLPTKVADYLANACSFYWEVHDYPLENTDPKWAKWTEKIREHWDQVEQNASVVIWNREWIRDVDIVLEEGVEDPEAVVKALKDHGIKSLVKAFNVEE